MKRGALLAALLLASTAGAATPDLDGLLVDEFLGPTLQIHFVDVGQGDAVLLQTPGGKHVLVDTGADTRARALNAYLDDLAVERLDMVVNTHAHSDHIGGLAALLRRWKVGLVLDSGVPHTSGTYERMLAAIEAAGVPVKVARRGRKITVEDGLVLEVLGPEEPLVAGSRSDLNSNSVIIRAVYRDVSVLLTGDAEHETEERLLRDPGSLAATVLKVAHHGSAHATDTRFLRAVKPLVAVVSCGLKNKYGHPAPKTMARLDDAGVRTYVTARDGDVVVATDGKRLHIETFPKPVVAVQDRSPALRRVPTGQAPPIRAVRPSVAGAPRLDASGVIDLNTASEAALRGLPGVGPKTARRIIAARPFANVDDLRRVKGIGKKKLEGVRGRVRTGPPVVAPRAAAAAVAELTTRGLPVDVNRASARRLDGDLALGPITAARIIARRPYASVDELALRVKGITARRMVRLRPLMRVGPARAAAVPAAASPAAGLVDLNSASAAELDRLPGIGPKTVARIIAARPFSSVDDLTRVKGIGKKKLARLRPLVTVR